MRVAVVLVLQRVKRIIGCILKCSWSDENSNKRKSEKKNKEGEKKGLNK